MTAPSTERRRSRRLVRIADLLPGTYLTDGDRLFEIEQLHGVPGRRSPVEVLLVNVASDEDEWVPVAQVLALRLVSVAPTG